MKILLANTYHYNRGGDTRNAFNLAELLRANGHQVRFFSMKHPANIPCEDERYFVDYIDYIELNKKKIGNLIKVLWRSVYYANARLKISELLDDFCPDIVHVHNIHAHITPSIFFEIKKRKIPICWTLNDYKLICPNSHFIIDSTGEICESCTAGKFYFPVLKKCKKNSLLASLMISLEAYSHKILNIQKMVDAFICQSLFQAKKLEENNFDEAKIHVLPLFVEKKKIFGANSTEKYVLFYGRIEKFKGIFTLLESMKLLPNVKLKIAGSIRSDIKEIFFGLLSDNVEYLGFVSDEELDRLKLNSLVVVVPSTNYENQPYSILESFASGKPVIASNIGGMKELVTEGVRGYLVEPGNVQQLADAIKRIIVDITKTMEMGENALKYIDDFHSAQKHYNCITEIYKQILKTNLKKYS